jgi:hypothetical protein
MRVPKDALVQCGLTNYQTSLNDLELDEGESKFSSSKFVDF